MALLLEIGYQTRPDQTTEGFLSGRDRHASSLVTCPFTLCTLALEAQVGQEGIGKTDQMQVCNCDPNKSGSGTAPAPAAAWCLSATAQLPSAGHTPG